LRETTRPCVTHCVPAAQDRSRKRRKSHVIADDDDDDDTETNSDADDDDDDDAGKRPKSDDDDDKDESDVEDESDDEGWKPVGILDERMAYDGKSYQRQYWVKRADDSRTKKASSSAKYTEADIHDTSDMPRKVRNQWRAQNPLAGLLWVYTGKGKPTRAATSKLATYKETWARERSKNV
jgi:hypothetical protein